MCTRNAAVAILSAIALISLPQEASAQTLLQRALSLFGFEPRIELTTFDPVENFELTEMSLMEPVNIDLVPLSNSPPIVNQVVFNLEETSDSHDWETINDWLLSGLPEGTPRIDPSLVLSSLNVDEQQFICLATNIYFEARGSTLDDQRSVALVTLNRTQHWRWRGAICDVVWERYQFSWTITANRANNRVRTASSWQTSQLVAYEVLRGYVPDITRGATNYYNPSVVRPRWADLVVQSERIGAHRYVVLRTTRDYNPPANITSLGERMYAQTIRSILRQMGIG